MSRKFQLTVLSALMAGAFVFTGNVASADSAQEYKAAMKPLLPTIERWVGDVRNVVGYAVVRPELACTIDNVTLAREGESLAADLRGSRDETPLGLQYAHDNLTVAVDHMTYAVSQTCADAHLAYYRVGGELDRYDTASGKLDNFVSGRFTRPPFQGSTPDQPGSVN